jgi:hypothetical protein
MSTATASSKDSVLEFFVQASNKHGFALDITLNVNGAVVSGTMISAKESLPVFSAVYFPKRADFSMLGKRFTGTNPAKPENIASLFNITPSKPQV